MKFTCIIPTYNSGIYITKILDQLNNIDSKILEVLVIDDGSTDDTCRIMSQYNSEQIKYYYFTNGGVSCARNHGIELAKGDYIIFFDADDEVDCNEFRNVLDTILTDNSDIDTYMMGYKIANENATSKIYSPYSPGIYGRNELLDLTERLIDVKFAKNYRSKYMGGKVYQYFVKRELFRKGLKFQNNLFFAEDLCYCMQLFNLTNNLRVINFFPYKYNIIEGSASHRYRNNLWEEWKGVLNFVKNYVEQKKYLNQMAYWAGKNAVRNYTINEKGNNLQDKLMSILNDPIFISALSSLDYSGWVFHEKIENYFMKRKNVYLLSLYETIFNKLKTNNL